jgi:hypothetical protein
LVGSKVTKQRFEVENKAAFASLTESAVVL